jgi:excisionase family DNA binding protein
MTPLLNTAQAAAYLAISKSHFEHSYRDWGIRPVKMGRSVRFSPQELDRYVTSREKGR